MKRVLLTVLAGTLAALPFVPARAADDSEKRFEFDGMLRARYEYNDNFTDEFKPNDDYQSFTDYRVYVGITGHFAKNVSAHVDIQDTGKFGGRYPSYSNPMYSTPNSNVTFYQGYVEAAKIGGSDFGLRVGRQEHTYGTELFLGDSDYYNGQTFDGVRGMWQHDGCDLNFFHYKLVENNPSISSDANLSGITYDHAFKTMGTVGGYVLFAQDLGNNGVLPYSNSHANLRTYGARWNNGMMSGDKLNMFDWNVEVAAQEGRARMFFTNINEKLGGWVGEGWFGYNFNAGDSHGRVHIGTLVTSGDKSSSMKFGEFNNFFGDFHAYNRFGDMDWVETYNGGFHDLTDRTIGYEHWIGADHYLMLSYHNFRETDTHQNHYLTGKIGHEFDLKYRYQYSKNVGLEVLVGQASANSVYNGSLTDPIYVARVQARLDF